MLTSVPEGQNKKGKIRMSPHLGDTVLSFLVDSKGESRVKESQLWTLLAGFAAGHAANIIIRAR